MKYSILKSNAESNEEGTEGARTLVLQGLQTRLKRTIQAAERFRQNAGPNAVMTTTWDSERGNAGHSPTVEVVGMPTQRAGVAQLRGMHESAQANTINAERLNAEVVRIRQWIVRQGAKLTPNGDIVWPKSARVVEYDHDLERRGLTRLTCRAKKLVMPDGTPFDTANLATAFAGPGYGIYVMSAEGHIHVSGHSVGHRHHSSLVAGEDVACAGEMKVERGVLTLLSNKSGHYQPDAFNLLQVLQELEDGGIPMDFKIWQLNANRSYERYASVHAFMCANGFDNRSFQSLLREQSARNRPPPMVVEPERMYEKVYEQMRPSSSNPYLFYAE